MHIQRRCDTRAMQALEWPTAAFFTLQVVEGRRPGGKRVPLLQLESKSPLGTRQLLPLPCAHSPFMSGSQAHNCGLHSQSGSRVRLIQNQTVPLDRAQRREVGPGPAVLLAAVVSAQGGVRGHHLQ